jgi:hypothetical protein
MGMRNLLRLGESVVLVNLFFFSCFLSICAVTCLEVKFRGCVY